MREFHEIQRFRQWWLWAVVVVALLGPVVVVLAVIIPQKPEDHEIFMILFALLLGLLPPLLLFTMRLETTIDGEGVHYRFRPVHRKQRTIPWDQIQAIAIRTYNPIREYGGWGIRFSLRNGTALNVGGQTGIQLELTNGKRILIGTQKAEEAAQVIQLLQSR